MGALEIMGAGVTRFPTLSGPTRSRACTTPATEPAIAAAMPTKMPIWTPELAPDIAPNNPVATDEAPAAPNAPEAIDDAALAVACITIVFAIVCTLE